MDNIKDNSFLEHFIDTIVDFLDNVQYDEPLESPTPEVREKLESTYEGSLRFFTQPTIQEQLSLSNEAITNATRSVARLAVYCWPNTPPEVMVQIAIHLTKLNFMDDFEGDYHADMATFLPGLLSGSEQKNPFWRVMLHGIPDLLRHFDSYPQYNIFRSTLDYYQSCWIEARGFKGDRGSDRFPTELRRLGQLGASVGAFMFPKAIADETKQFGEITSAIVHVEPAGALVNDLFSFYKEGIVTNGYGPLEDNNLIMNVCHVKQIPLREGFDEVAADAIRQVQKAQEVFDGSHTPIAEDGVHTFIRGLIRWHLCDRRYRMKELYDASYGFETGRQFRKYCHMAWKAGGVAMDQNMFEVVDKRVSTRHQL